MGKVHGASGALQELGKETLPLDTGSCAGLFATDVPFAVGATQVVRMEDKDNIPVDNRTLTPLFLI